MSLVVEAVDCCLTPATPRMVALPSFTCLNPPPPLPHTPRAIHHTQTPCCNPAQPAQPLYARTHARDAPLLRACCTLSTPLYLLRYGRHHNPSLHTHSPEKQQRRPPPAERSTPAADACCCRQQSSSVHNNAALPQVLLLLLLLLTHTHAVISWGTWCPQVAAAGACCWARPSRASAPLGRSPWCTPCSTAPTLGTSPG